MIAPTFSTAHPRRIGVTAIWACAVTALSAQTDVEHLGDASWTNPAGWSTGQLPGSSDTAVLNAGTLTVDGDFAIDALKMNGGTLAGEFDAATDSITLLGGRQAAYWRNGTISNITLNVGSGSLFEIDHSSTATSSGSIFVFDTESIIDWLDGDILLNQGGAISNYGTWYDSAAGSGETHAVRTTSGASGSVSNESGATYVAQGGGTTRFDVSFDNQGSLQVDSGSTVILNGGGTMTTDGTMLVAAGGELKFADDYAITDAIKLQGAGQYTLSGGTLSMAGNLAAQDFQITGGTLNGSVAFLAGATWTGGTIGAGFTTNASDSSFVIANPSGNTFNATSFVNAGQVLWNDGDILLYQDATLTNGVTGSWQDDAAGAGETHQIRSPDASTNAAFTNRGTYSKSSEGTTRVLVPLALDSSGVVQVYAGTFIIDGGGYANTGTSFDVASGATLSIHSDFAIDDANGLLGDGQVALDDGKLTLNGFVSAPDFAINGGILTGDHTFLAGATWAGGELRDGATYNQPGSTFNLNDPTGNTLNNHYLDSSGTMVWNDGDILLNGDTTLSNQGDFNDDATASGESHSIRRSDASSPAFINYAESTYNKTSAGTTRMQVYFNHNSTLNIYDGVFRLEGTGVAFENTTLFVDSPGELVFASDFELQDAGSLSGDGLVTLESGTLNTAGDIGVARFDIVGGTLSGTVALLTDTQWTGGTIAANLTNQTTGTLTIADPTGNTVDGGTLINEGQVEWDDGDILLNNTASITNQSGAIWTDDAAAAEQTHTIRSSTATPASFTNAGTYEKVNLGTTRIDVPFYNEGTVDIYDGVLDLGAGGNATDIAAFNVGAGSKLTFSAGYDLTDASSLQGAGEVFLTGGTLYTTGNVDVGSFNLNGGTLIGTLTFNEALYWNNGTLGTAGSTHISSTGELTLADPTGNSLDNNTLIIDGVAYWQDGDIILNNSSTATTSVGAVWHDLATASGETHTVRVSSGDPTYFTNLGDYVKDSAGDTRFEVAFNNSGAVDVNAGQLILAGGGSATSGASFDVASDAALVVRDEEYVINEADGLTGSGALQLESGGLSLSGTLSALDFSITGGVFSGYSTLATDTTWSGGTFGNYGFTTIAPSGTLTLANPSSNRFEGHSVENYGTVLWNSGSLILNDYAGLTNYGTVTEQTGTNNAVYSSSQFGDGYFTNNEGGLFEKTSDTNTDFELYFLNYGDVSVTAGELRLKAGGYIESGSTIDVASGAAVVYRDSANFTIVDAASLTGAGTHQVTDTTVMFDGELSAFMRVENSTLGGTHILSDNFLFLGGSFDSSGTTTISSSGVLMLQDASGNTFDGRTLLNEGLINLTYGDLLLDNGATLTNDGTLLLDSSATHDTFTVHTATGSSGLIQNQLGAQISLQGQGTTHIDVPLENAGTLDAGSGHLVLTGGGYGTSDAAFKTDADGTLTFESNFQLTDIASLQGPGGFRVGSDTLTASGTLGADLVIDGGSLDGDVDIAGTLEFTGDDLVAGHTLSVLDEGTLILDSPAGFTLTGSGLNIDSTGTLRWLDGNLNLGPANALTNEGEIEFSGLSAELRPTTAGATFTNHGVLRLVPGVGNFVIDLPFTNTGTIVLQEGQLSLTQDSILDPSSDIQLADVTEFRIDAGTTTVTDARIFSGDGAVVQLGGTLNLDGDLSVDLHLIEGTFNTSTLVTSGELRIDDAIIPTDADFGIVDGGVAKLDRATFDLGNTTFEVDASSQLHWTGGTLLTDTAGGFAINGLMLIKGDGTYGASVSTPGVFLISSTGNVRKTAGTGSLVFDAPISLDGRLEVHSGDITLNAGGYADQATIDIWNGASLLLPNGFEMRDGTSVINGGALRLTGGTFDLSGDIGLGNDALFSGGTITGTHTLSGTLTWTGGDFDANGATTIANDSILQLLNFTGTHLERDLTIDGQMLWGVGDITGTDATITNNGNILLSSDGTISSADDSLELQNNGIFAKVGGSDTSTIDVPVTNAGYVLGGSGTLHFANTFTFAGGTIGVQNGGLLTFAAPLALPASTTLAGNGTVTADISTGGTISPGASVGSLTIDGDLTLESGALSFFEIDYVDTALAFDRLTVTGTLTLAGDLEIDFLTAIDPISTDMFTLYTAASLLGDFDNVANGGQVWADLPDGGRGIFTVNYGVSSLFDPNSVILSDFEFSPIPEPSTWALMITGLGLIGVQLYRRRRRA
ncbi:PEPxxWA-CTERM sorting domain-containing protein [Actomonas aquatica]|uniref:PEPxxWA-CTERM sorting domain-containing protein n=1 Tax=Actomonas aquatica TaxID=2866162 RepID=A0ABZ1CCC7_9BACT|nr:PEPxxWA-CTERM sorting domain-containing protein [Opitutus sp. WL0086]WRQ89226.1 PEPxxWA-CTERM sorting domain-containing protein [Opitutus sp. WL0086]